MPKAWILLLISGLYLTVVFGILFFYLVLESTVIPFDYTSIVLPFVIFGLVFTETGLMLRTRKPKWWLRATGTISILGIAVMLFLSYASYWLNLHAYQPTLISLIISALIPVIVFFPFILALFASLSIFANKKDVSKQINQKESHFVEMLILFIKILIPILVLISLLLIVLTGGCSLGCWL